MADGTYGRKADTTVAEDRRRDAVPARGGQLVVPCRLPVVVSVRIDEARRDERAVRVEHFAGGSAERADLDADSIGHADVGTERRRTPAVDDRSALQQKVVHGGHFLISGGNSSLGT